MKSNRLYRVLLDPSTENQGGQGQQEQGQQQQQQLFNEEQTEEVRLSRAEYDRLMAAQEEREQLHRQQQESRRTTDERVAALEQRYTRAAIKGQVGDALGRAGEFISPQAREDAKRLLGTEVETRDIDGEVVVYHKPTGKPLSEVDQTTLEQRLGYFLKPQTQGGTGGGEGHRAGQNIGQQADPYAALRARYATARKG